MFARRTTTSPQTDVVTLYHARRDARKQRVVILDPKETSDLGTKPKINLFSRAQGEIDHHRSKTTIIHECGQSNGL